MAERGRPRINIDKKMFEDLCGLWCTKEEIAGYFKCSIDTIERWVKRTYDNKTFTDVFNQYCTNGQISLRRNQLRLSERSAAMAIFLGKQYLGQSDCSEVELTGKVVIKNDIPIPPEILKELENQNIEKESVAND